jgi:hypothetical protein
LFIARSPEQQNIWSSRSFMAPRFCPRQWRAGRPCTDGNYYTEFEPAITEGLAVAFLTSFAPEHKRALRQCVFPYECSSFKGWPHESTGRSWGCSLCCTLARHSPAGAGPSLPLRKQGWTLHLGFAGHSLRPFLAEHMVFQQKSVMQ